MEVRFVLQCESHYALRCLLDRRPGNVSTRFGSGIQTLLRPSSRSSEDRKSALPTILCSFCTFLTSEIPHTRRLQLTGGNLLFVTSWSLIRRTSVELCCL